MNLLPLLATAFGLGLVHSFDVDHLCAVTSFASGARSVRQAFWLGLRWAVGHTLALLLFGVGLVVFKLALPGWFEPALEIVVGAVLVVIGIAVIRDVFKHRHIHAHWHEHDGSRHFHFHSHASDNIHRHAHRLTWIGMLHGLAGTSGVMVLIPVMAARNLTVALAYILIFGLGTMASMALFGACAGSAFRLVGRWQWLFRSVKTCVGLASCIVGAVWIARQFGVT